MVKSAKLVHNKKEVVSNLRYLTSVWQISRGLMFAGKKKIEQGVCLVMPAIKDVKFGASVTMYFCFSEMDILFVNSKMKVVDKVTLKPWVTSYTPKEECKYVFESSKGKFKDIKIGTKINLEFNN